MKYLTLLFAFLPVFAFSQQECQLIRETDPYTKQKTISTGFIDLQGASLTIDASKPEIDLLFTLKGLDKCFTDASTAAIFFEGTKTRQTQRNNGSMNCEGLFHFIFRNGTTAPLLLRKMATQKIQKIVFTGNDKLETVVTLDADQQLAVMTLTACIIKEAPTLLQ